MNVYGHSRKSYGASKELHESYGGGSQRNKFLLFRECDLHNNDLKCVHIDLMSGEITKQTYNSLNHRSEANTSQNLISYDTST